jgi:hypothetical protein
LYSKSPVLGEPLGIPPIILFTAEREGILTAPDHHFH